MSTTKITSLTPITPERVSAAREILSARYQSFPYGYSEYLSGRWADRVARKADAEQIAVVLGEFDPCHNCGRIAITKNRCAACQHLPSDEA